MSTDKDKKPETTEPPIDAAEYNAAMGRLSLIQAAPRGSGINRLSEIVREVFIRKPK